MRWLWLLAIFCLAVCLYGLGLVWSPPAHAQPASAPKTMCTVVESLAAADDNLPLWTPSVAVTIKTQYCTCVGTCTTPATIALEDGAGNAMTGTATCGTATVSRGFTQITAGGGLIAQEVLAMDVTNAVSPETDKYVICWTYVVN